MDESLCARAKVDWLVIEKVFGSQIRVCVLQTVGSPKLRNVLVRSLRAVCM